MLLEQSLPKSFMNEKLKKGKFSLRKDENMLALRYQDKERNIYAVGPQCIKLIPLMFEGETGSKTT